MNGTHALSPGTQLSMDTSQYESTMQMQDSFAFVANVAHIEGADKAELVPGHVLRRATHEEIEIIKASLGVSQGGLLSPHFSPWEIRKESNGQFTELPEAEWEYFVISFKGSNEHIVTLEHVFCIAPIELKLAFTAVSWPPDAGRGLPGRIYHQGRLLQMFNHPLGQPPERLVITPSDIEQVSTLFTVFNSHDTQLVSVQRITGQMLELEALPWGSPSKFLGYFGILESLLTHKPHPNDQYDSITRQVKNKVALLDHRWSPCLDYFAFNGAKEDAVWTKMYAYRSALAHGDTADFGSELKMLGSHENAMELLKSAVKAIARLALKEPQLMVDLKRC